MIRGRYLVRDRPAHPARRARPGLVLALAIADTGNAIPFGLASGPRSNAVTPAEWTLSALYAIAAVALYARVIGLRGPHMNWAWLISAGCWAASASYAAWLPHSTVRHRIAFGLIFGGLALVALFAHAREVEATRGGPP